jgi:branched-chain amino acid transport system substrate-binding protein
MKRTLLVLSTLVLAAIVLAACGGGAQEYTCEDPLGCVTYAPDEPIRIASALVISGPDAQLGLDSQYGVEVAIALKGQVDGHDVELQAEDDGCNAEGGQAAGQKIVSDPSIIGVVGTSCSGAGVPMSKVISDAGYFMVSPSNTAPSLTDPEQAWNPGYLRTAHNDKVQGAAIADFATTNSDWRKLPPSMMVTPTRKAWRTRSRSPSRHLVAKLSHSPQLTRVTRTCARC